MRYGCIDNPLQNECRDAKNEIEDFVSAVMQKAQGSYVEQKKQLLNLALNSGKITYAQYHELNFAIDQQRDALSAGVENRDTPACNKGAYTTTPYTQQDYLKAQRDSENWNMQEVRDGMVCTSKTLQNELARLQADNQVDPDLRIRTDLDVYGFNENISRVLSQYNPQTAGLSPYTKRLIETVLEQIDDQAQADNYGILNGKEFAEMILNRVLLEPPAVITPEASVAQQLSYDLGINPEGKSDCFPLNTLVLVRKPNTTAPAFEARQLSELAISDEVVIGLKQGQPQTSKVVDFAHRNDSADSNYIQVVYSAGENSAHASKPLTLFASRNHNLEFGVQHPETGEIVAQKSTFDKLQKLVENQQSTFIKNGHGQWLPVQVVTSSIQKGLIAPITANGTLTVLPPELANTLPDTRALDTQTVVNLTENMSSTSCFSTVPDKLGKIANDFTRRVFGANANAHGAGEGPLLDMISTAAHAIVSRWTNRLS
ncbi:MAG: hypothetical protein HC848_09255 [Limnobacter sp.]|nr:hypothetical protein [Limnobacter sp.]